MFRTAITTLLLLCAMSATSQELDDRQLLQRVASYCVMGSHEENECRLMREAASRFQMPALDEYADLLSSKQSDTGDSCLRQVTGLLVEKAEAMCGKESEEALRCRRAQAIAWWNIDDAQTLQMAEENVVLAQRLEKKHPKQFSLQRLRIITQLEQLIIVSSQSLLDNPQKWEPVYEIEKELETWNDDRLTDSEDLLEIYIGLADLKSYSGVYTEYANSLFGYLFPNGTKIGSVFTGEGLFTNAQEYKRMAFEMSKRIHGENHLTTLSIERDLIVYQMQDLRIEGNEAHQRLSEIVNIMTEKCSPTDLALIQAQLCLWDCDITNRTNLWETTRYNTLLLRVASRYETHSLPYLLCLYRVMSQRMHVDLNQAVTLADELTRTAEQLFGTKSGRYWEFQLNLAMIKQTTLDREKLAEYVDDMMDYYKHHHMANWQSVSYGHALSQYLSELFAKPKDAASIHEIALNDIKKITGEQSMFYATQMLHSISVFSDAQQHEKALKTAWKTVELYRAKNIMVVQIYNLIGDIYHTLNRIAEAKKALQEGISTCSKDDEKLWKAFLQIKLGATCLDTHDLDEAKTYFQQGLPTYLSSEDKYTGVFTEGAAFAATYYQTMHDYATADSILTDAMQQYSALYHRYDNTYIGLITYLFNLYAYKMNDMDRAERLIEGHIEHIRQSPSYADHAAVVQFLWLNYYMVKQKNPGNLVKIISILSDIRREITTIANLANASDPYEYRWLIMPMINETTQILIASSGGVEQEAKQLETIIARTTNEDVRRQLQQMYELNKQSWETSLKAFEDMLPILNEIEKRYRKDRPRYKEEGNYQQIANNLSLIYLYLKKDTATAEKWMLTLIDSPNPEIRLATNYNVAMYEMRRGRYAESLPYLLQVQELQKQLPFMMNGAKDQADFCSWLFMGYYQTGHTKEALSTAREYYRLRQQIINQNFDLLTQSEREGLLNNGGAGGEPLQMLLPLFPDTLSAEIYNTVLNEKGILLRASDRMQQTIKQSGDEKLMTALDSLAMLNAQYKQLDQTNMFAQNDSSQARFQAVSALMYQIETLERWINRTAQQYGLAADTIPSWQQVQQALHTNEAAIEYVFSDSIIGALVLRPDSRQPQYVKLINGMQFFQQLEKLNQYSSRLRTDRLYQNDELDLYEKLWKPMEPLLNGVKDVYFSPTGYLNTLAFAAIKCPDGQYLMDHYQLHQLTSTADLTKRGLAHDHHTSAMLLGAVYYSPEQEQLAKDIRDNEADRGSIDGRGVVDDEEEAFGYLPYTLEEVDDIEKIMQKAHVDCQMLTGFKSTEPSLATLSGQSPSILHLSTHGFFVATEEDVMANKFLARFPAMRFWAMQRSGLALVGANDTWNGNAEKEESDDGILTAAEVALLDLRKTRLAVLSACQTGVGLYNRDGVYGMQRGFKQAGVRSILATLWNVNDKSTAELMKAFYGKWLSGTGMQQSMQESIQELRKAYPAPFYWAPFILMDAEN